jgi:hypothetical protein
MYPQSFGQDSIAFHASDGVLYQDSLAGFCFVFGLLGFGQFGLPGFFVRDGHLFAQIVLLEALISQVQAHFKGLEPRFVRRELAFEDGIIVRFAHIDLAQKPNPLVFCADDQGFGRVGFFLPL